MSTPELEPSIASCSDFRFLLSMLPSLLLVLSLVFLPTLALPPALPLAVRTPTFNVWVDTRDNRNPAFTWPKFWNDDHILGWAGYIRVDGTAYHWLGAGPGNGTRFRGATITPTRTIFSMEAGPVSLNVTFLSPIEPDDLARGSLPFSYVYVEGGRTDGKNHTIQLYSDTTAEWLSIGVRTQTPIRWQSQETENAAYLEFQLVSPSSTFGDIAEDGTAIYATAVNAPGRQSLIATARQLRNAVTSNETTLELTSDLLPATQGFVQQTDGAFPLLGHYIDLGNVSTIPTTAWVVGLARDPVVTFQGVARHAYYRSRWKTLPDAVDAFVADFPAAKQRALALDERILADANAISADYADLVSLGLRQALAGLEITVPQLSDGSYNTSDVLVFLKDTGYSQRVNPTETMYALMPALLYLNGTLLGQLLEPMFRVQRTDAYAAPDLGTPYPRVSGNVLKNDGVGVEHSANMIIMVLAHARATGDGSLISRYYTTLKAWAEYLSDQALSPSQQSADATTSVLGQASGGLTNLGVKGIVGVAAMAEISKVVGDVGAAESFRTSVANLTQVWTTRSLFSGSLAWEYNKPGSSGLMYNLFADRLLQLGVFSDEVYKAQDATASFSEYGMALSTGSNSMTRSDWTMFSAAAAASNSTRDKLISGVLARAMLNSVNGTFANLYGVQTGQGVSVAQNGFASPAQGAILSLLSLSLPNRTIIAAGDSATPGIPAPNHKNTMPAIISGIVVGSTILLVLGVFGACFLLRARRRPEREHVHVNVSRWTKSCTAISEEPSLSTREDTPTPTPTPTSPIRFLFRPPSKVAELTAQERRRLALERRSLGADSDWRRELVNLRMEMAEIRAKQDEGAPPKYQ
ncbi:hypothetical protein MKEN_00957400 [Mycena kentingensis (nom. inval.)]|nr:hypothetical protein MKEN_00957400 [Mycena kentingensis (nom. inval.)]